MKSGLVTACVVLLLAGVTLSVGAEATFDSGSDGSDGALVLSASATMDLPPNGIFNFTTGATRPRPTTTRAATAAFASTPSTAAK